MKAEFTPPCHVCARRSKVCEFVRGLMIGGERFGTEGRTSVVEEVMGMPYLDKELCDPHLARGMTRIRDDVQSDLGPYLLQFPCGRRLFLARWHHRWLDGGGTISQKG